MVGNEYRFVKSALGLRSSGEFYSFTVQKPFEAISVKLLFASRAIHRE